MSTRSVKLLATGGTIATITDPVTGRSRAARRADELIGEPGLTVALDTEDISLMPSWAMGPLEMQRVARAACVAAGSGEYQGVVVTHGTTTLEYTAFMTDLFFGGAVPVVFTGAMRRADDPDSDGPRNLRDAIRVATSDASRNRGVLVCFHGQVLSARDAWKKERSDTDAFIGLEGPLGLVDEAVSYRRQSRRHRVFVSDVEAAVSIVKAFPGCDAAVLLAVIHAGTRGIVLEGLPGAGGVPTPMRSGLEAAADRGIPVVLSSRAPAGRLPVEPTGGTGEPLRGLGLISAGDLTTEKAWVLMMVALGEVQTVQGVKAIFEEMTAIKEEE
jgi:L-asparaginase